MGCRGTFVGDRVLQFPSNGDKRLTDAVKKGDLKTVKALVGSNPNLLLSKDKYGDTPLNDALEYGQKAVWVPAMCEFLISKKADVNALDDSGMTPLQVGARNGNKEVVEFLRQHGGQ